MSNVPAAPDPEFHMDLPGAQTYKDLHGGMMDSLPPVTLDRVKDFFEACDKGWDSKFQELYEERYVRFV